MRPFGAWLGFGLCAVVACGSDPEPNAAPVGTAGAGGATGSVSMAGVPAPVAGAAGLASATAGGPGVAGTEVPIPMGSPAGQGAAGMPAAGGGGDSGRTAAGNGGAAGAAAGRGAAGASGMTGMAGGGAAGAAGSGMVPTEKFSFFVTSLSGMRELSGSQMGFGGNLTFGEPTGLAGADKICTQLAEKSMPGSGTKVWRAFLSTSKGGANGGPVHARDRVGQGPWYDRTGRLVASNLNALLQNRPSDADTAIRNDLPNERGEPNHTDTVPGMDDNHDTVTGSSAQGMYDGSNTCSDWTSTSTTGLGPMVGHSWPSQVSGVSWIRAHNAPGCAPSVALVQVGGGMGNGIGNAGGYGGIYCLALSQ